MSCVQGFINIFSRGAGNFAKDMTIDRANIVKVLTFHRGNKFTADIVTVAFSNDTTEPVSPGLA